MKNALAAKYGLGSWDTIDLSPHLIRVSNQNMLNDSSSMKKNDGSDVISIGGLTSLTTIDYPGQLAAVVFMQGCPWKCRYCHNGDLIPRVTKETSDTNLNWSQVVTWLETRQGLLDAVVFSGGEPTLQSGLYVAMNQVREMGFRVGLHTAGIYPDRFQKLMPLIDWVGFDIKADRNDYPRITGVQNSGDRAWKSAELLLASGIKHEFRTTIHNDLLNEQQLQSLVDELISIGASHYVVQSCVTERCLDKTIRISRTPGLSDKRLDQLGRGFKQFEIRKH